MNPLHFFLLLILIVSCAPPSPKLESILRLAPPEDVSVQCESDSCRISWRASTQEDEENFAGYQIYVSNTSLLFASPNQLPTPITVGKNKKMVVIEKPKNTVFIHVRSYTVDGKISLPSLPEFKIAD